MLVLSLTSTLGVILLTASDTATVAEQANYTYGFGSNRNDGPSSILIESFQDPRHTWIQRNDPVMGGRSTGNFTIDTSRGVGVFMGEVVNVPFLHAPGFIQVRTVDHHLRKTSKSSHTSPFPDVSRCAALALSLRSPSSAEYQGFRVSFGTKHANGGKPFAYGFKTDLKNVMSDWTDVVLPFSAFTDFWDDATGDAIRTCQENPEYCPDLATLQNMRTMALWAEGVVGRVDLEIREIRAVGCSAASSS